MESIRIGMAQMLVEGARPEANLRRAGEMIASAADRGCHVVVLPECLDIGWTHPAARELAEPIPGLASDQLARAAQAGGIHVVAGLVERAGQKLYNASVLISPAGQILLKHRKINELAIAHDLYSLGQSLAVVQTPMGTIGITICADNAPGVLALGESLARMGARLLLSPCAWAVPPEHDNASEPYGGMWREAYAALAQRHGLTVVGVSNVGVLSAGPWQGWRCIGNSLAVGAGGVVLAELPHGASAQTLHVLDLPATDGAPTGPGGFQNR
jgi:predicted amidohydrolase